MQDFQDPNLKSQTAITQKLCISDSSLVKPILMILELEQLLTVLLVYNFSKKHSTARSSLALLKETFSLKIKLV